jgi:hypothetical protein
MSDFDLYADWLHELSYLSDERTRELPAWQRLIAFVQQFAVTHLNDGAGSLFYNDPEKIESVIASLVAIDEPELAKIVRSIAESLAPVFREGGENLQQRLVKRIDGSEAPLAARLDRLIEERWDEIHRKMKVLADAGGWRP